MTHVDTAAVPFHGADLLTLRIDGVIHIAMKPVVEALGLDWRSQLKRIWRDPILREGVVKRATAFSTGQKQILLPIALFHGWLFGVSVGAVKPELRPLLSSLIREGHQALHDYWSVGAAVNPRLVLTAATRAEQVAARRDGPRLIALLKGETDPEVRRYYHSLLGQGCAVLGVPLPPLERIGRDAGDLFDHDRGPQQ